MCQEGARWKVWTEQRHFYKVVKKIVDINMLEAQNKFMQAKIFLERLCFRCDVTNLDQLTALYDGAEQYFGGGYHLSSFMPFSQNADQSCVCQPTCFAHFDLWICQLCFINTEGQLASHIMYYIMIRAGYNLLQQRWDQPHCRMEKMSWCQHCE